MTHVPTLGSSPNNAQCFSDIKLFVILMMSLHFLGVSSTLPARNKQQAAVTYNQNIVETKINLPVWRPLNLCSDLHFLTLSCL